ncbi:hypothetical protein SAMN04488052_102400 [Aquisalimonas asiatica]|uniref:Uncharacterized protein n=2 Tax=Aquisalimonas asiatica TaxID=406100 RepID=A0A1H8S298_9GAMM|nr:hypothetical protein SAMN04488052_102400 [Aquisalimonas asiatica]
MTGMKSAVRYGVAWIGAVAVAAVLGSIVQSQFSMAAIVSLGVEVTPAQWLGVTVRDLFGFAPVWALVVAAALLLAFPVAGLLARRAPDARMALYFLAGGVGVMCALVIMAAVLPVTPVAAARSPFGMALMALGGAVGGVAFARWTAARG